MGKLIKSFFVNDYFIAICSGAWIVATTFAITGGVERKDWLLAVLFFCSTVIIYNIDRLFGDNWMEVIEFIKKPFKTSLPEKARANLMHQSLFFGVILYCLAQLSFKTISALIIPFVVSIFYAVPIFGKNRRPRDIPFLKIFLIAFVWAWVSTIPAGIVVLSQTTTWAIIASRFCFIYAITIPFDLRDMLFDKSHNTQTIPHKIGHRQAIVTALSALFLGVSLAFINNTHDKWGHLVASAIAAILIVNWNAKRPYYYYLFFLDGCILLHAALIVAFKHFGL